MRTLKRHIIALVLLVGVFPASLHAQVKITEIMYDLPGTDSGREWVEVLNTGSDSVTLTDWKFRESDSNHGLVAFQGGEILTPGGYAVIVDSPEKFLSDNLGFSGQVFDSSFSLSNSGELLVIRDPEGNDTDSLSYSNEVGAAGDGNTLHRTSVGSSNLAVGAPSPGSGVVDSPMIESSDNGSEDTPENTSAENNSSVLVTPKIRADAGDDRDVFVGAATALVGRAYNDEGEEISGARFVWNFGDGELGEGQKVLHTWMHPGKYAVILNVSHNRYGISDKIVVAAIEPELIVTTKENDIIVQNPTSREADISGWLLRSDGYTAGIPENTIILPSSQIRFRSEITNLNVASDVALLYPNGTEAVLMTFQSEPIDEVESILQEEPEVETRIVYVPVPAEPDEEVKSEEPVEEKFATTSALLPKESQTASAASFVDLNTPWMWGLFALIGVAVLGLLAARQAKGKEWTIIEEE